MATQNILNMVFANDEYEIAEPFMFASSTVWVIVTVYLLWREEVKVAH